MAARTRTSKSNGQSVTLRAVPTIFQIYEVLSDPLMAKILKIAYSGVKGDFSNVVGNLTKRKYSSRLQRLKEMGLVEKQRHSMYRTTALGSLVYDSNFRALEKILEGYWHLQAVDALKARTDLPGDEREALIKQLLEASNLNQIVNDTHLSGFSIVRDFESLIVVSPSCAR